MNYSSSNFINVILLLEALGISSYCALKFRSNFKEALIAAVNHNGDSDSTGAITGNILGAYLGLSNIPVDWVEKVEFKDSFCKSRMI